MVGWILALLGVVYALGIVRSALRRDLSGSAYPSPDEAEAEIDALARAHPRLCALEEIGKSSEGRPLRALRLRGSGLEAAGEGAPRLLVTAHIHAVEYVGSFVARRVARRLAEGYGSDEEVTALLDRAEVVIVPLLNPDGAARVWRRGGWSGLGMARFTATGVDPNRNFPFPARTDGCARAWNAARSRPGSAYYRGPFPLSEPECRALAELCARERFCGAIHFHSFGAVVYLPAPGDHAPDPRIARALAVFRGAFQSRQHRRRYRALVKRAGTGAGQLDTFLVAGLGTPSVTVEVSLPGLAALAPGRIGNAFWIANPAHPGRWAHNDAEATVHALGELLARTEGQPGEALHPDLSGERGR